MLRKVALCGLVFLLVSCAAISQQNKTTSELLSVGPSYQAQRAAAATPTSTYSPIDVTAAMRAGITSSRPFELVYALQYATNRTDKAVPETFGGLSSMLFHNKVGGRLTFEIISDQGHIGLLDVPNAMDARRAQNGGSKVVMLPMRGPDGALLSGSSNVDSEGLARTPGGRLISFERNHRVLELNDGAAFAGHASKAGPTLTGFDGLEPNGGIEAIVALPNGQYLASAEYGRKDQGGEAALKPPYWIFGLNQAGPIAPIGSFQNTGGFGVTEARVMDNDLWLLKREYDFSTKINKARLERCPLAGVLAGTPVCTLELALEPPFVMDNYEGLEIFKEPRTGNLYFYIMSDDNFDSSQRTIVLAFKAQG